MPDSSRNPSRGPPRKDLPFPKATDRPGIQDRKNPPPPDRARNRPIPGRNRIPAEVTTAATTLPRPPTQAVTTVEAAEIPVAAAVKTAAATEAATAAEMAAAAAAKPAAEMAAETPEAAVETALGKTEEKRRGCIPARP